MLLILFYFFVLFICVTLHVGVHYIVKPPNPIVDV
jgi:hypothetical protein